MHVACLWFLSSRHHPLSRALLARHGDTNLAYHRMTLREANIKCADISNPSLLDLVVKAVLEMHPYSAQCDLNFVFWTAQLAILQAAGDASNATARRAYKGSPRAPVPAICAPDDYRGVSASTSVSMPQSSSCPMSSISLWEEEAEGEDADADIESEPSFVFLLSSHRRHPRTVDEGLGGRTERVDGVGMQDAH
ncbi:hypothetical protein B0H19DRAFT_1062860 [Mycena capillaripes]|nr:hypothetical protein B0H19DRAFT_1062860 [Mycena capillaripes]